MFTDLKRSWNRLKNAPPGKRFCQQYEANQREARPAWAKPVWILLGVAITAGGVVALPAPGPGFLIIGLGLAFLARESKHAARAADWLEVKGRAILAWSVKRWKAASTLGRVGIVTAGVAVAAGAGWLAWVLYLREKLT